MAITAESLRTAIKSSRRKMERYLKERKEAIREFVGAHFSENGSEDKIPLPMLSVAVNVYLRNIVARAPRYLVTTDKPELKPQASEFELVLNDSVQKSDIERVLRDSAMHAMFAFALVKTGMEVTSTVLTDELTGEQEEVPIGQPFSAVIDPDDVVIDMTARTWDEVEFIGHRFRVPMEQLKLQGGYEESQLKNIQTTAAKQTSESRSSDISNGGVTSEGDELFPRVELWEIYVPGTNEIYVLPADDGDFLKPPEQWTGPRNPLGPYRFMGMVRAPGQLLPVPPTALWMDLSQAANALWRKLIRQGQRCKKVGIARDPETAKAIMDARDGDVVSAGPSGVALEEITTGQPDQLLTTEAVALKSMFAYYSQSDVIGGMAPTSETLGQDRLIHASASQLVDDMQDQMVRFAKEIGHDQAFFHFYFSTREVQLVKRLRGYDIGIPVQWDPWGDRGDYLDYQFNIEPYSMRGQTPSQQLQVLTSAMQLIMPLAQMLPAEGKQISATALVDAIAKYTNSPDITAIIRDIEPVPPQMPTPGMQEGGPGKPPVTERTYTRKNVSEKTNAGQDAALMQTLMGGAQPNEQKAVVA